MEEDDIIDLTLPEEINATFKPSDFLPQNTISFSTGDTEQTGAPKSTPVLQTNNDYDDDVWVDDKNLKRILSFDVGIRNFAKAVITMHKETEEFAIEELRNDDVLVYCGSKIKDSKQVPGDVLTRYFIEFLFGTCQEILNKRLDAIIIEQQPGLGQKMKTLAYTVYSFFYLHYLQRGKTCPPITIQSAKGKLKIVVEPIGGKTRLQDMGQFLQFSTTSRTTKTPTKNDNPQSAKKAAAKQKKEQYKKNKKYAEEQCENFLQRFPKCRKFLDFYHGLKKKDDVADAVLQGVYFLKTSENASARRKSGPVVIGATSSNSVCQTNTKKKLVSRKSQASIDHHVQNTLDASGQQSNDDDSIDLDCFSLGEEEEEEEKKINRLKKRQQQLNNLSTSSMPGRNKRANTFEDDDDTRPKKKLKKN